MSTKFTTNIGQQAGFNNTELSKLVSNLRNHFGLSQQELAALVDLQQPIISRWENPNYGKHSLRSLQKLADALNCDFEITFTTRTDNPDKLYKPCPKRTAESKKPNKRKPKVEKITDHTLALIGQIEL